MKYFKCTLSGMENRSRKFPVKCFTFPGIAIFVFVLLLTCFAMDQEQCHSSSEMNSHMFLATKTPYRFLTNKDDSPLNYQGCEAKKIWMIIRHGTRNPGAKMIRKMRERLPEIKEKILENHKNNIGNLCEGDLKYFHGWLPHVEEIHEKHLTYEGEDEMVELAERFQKRFPNLLPETYSNTTYKFRFTATQRTEASAKHFAIGLFGRRVSRYVWFPESLHRDPILRFYKLCSRWKTEVDKNPHSYVERNKFKQGPQMKATLEDVAHRLGFETTLTMDDLHTMYMTCSFETAWDKRTPSPWCSAFSDENLKVMEYAEDLEYYWIDGYGYDITYKQACPAFKDMIHHLRHDGAESPSAVAYFTHSGTLLKMLSHLGLYQDRDELRHDTFDSMAAKRNWRVGRMDSFASNLAFVLYECGGEEPEQKVLTLHQERPVTLPGCPEGQLCPMDVLASKFSDSIFNCDFDELCSLPTK